MSRRHASARQLEREAEEWSKWGDGPVAEAIVAEPPKVSASFTVAPDGRTTGLDAALVKIVRAATTAKKRLTPAQAKAVREEMADSGSSRAEAEAWVLGMGAK